MQPSLRQSKRKRKSFGAFKGLCLRPILPNGYFADAENLIADGYPAILPRARRGVITETSAVHAMFSHAKMCWLMHDTLYYGSVPVGNLTPGEKQFASVGAYVVIYPDKKVLDTVLLTLSDMDNETRLAGITVAPCNADGSDAVRTNYVRFTGAGIGAGFREGDGIEICGLTGEVTDGSYLVQAVQADMLVVIALCETEYTEAEEVVFSRRAPDLDFLCALDNRVWGANSADHTVYASKLGDVTNWNVFQGISTDSYRAVLPTPGVFTGACADLGSVIFFKEEEIIKLYGSKPSNFQLISYKMPGVEIGSEMSVAYSESVLFYKGTSGIYQYDGSVPEMISASLGAKRYTGARAGAANGKYYVSMREADSGEARMFVYDVKTGIWYRENAPQTRYFAKCGNELYFACADGNTYSVNGGGLWFEDNQVITTIRAYRESGFAWYAETGPIRLEEPEKQYITALHIRFSLEKGASLKVSMRLNESAIWKTAGEFTGPVALKTHTLPVSARRSDSAFLRFEGEGGFSLTELIKTYQVGSDA